MLMLGCPQSKVEEPPGQSKKEGLQVVCDSHAKNYSDADIARLVTHPEMVKMFNDAKTGELTGDALRERLTANIAMLNALREELRRHATETGVDCKLLNTLDAVNEVMAK